ncbi:hypothetical protein NKH98_15555 [Mesorhizobium sp. M0833]|uniref:hypothetical protein n=1 Tax=Mesorhizobium sp. M0833 TaxID=2957009 RepID=UPI003338A107
MGLRFLWIWVGDIATRVSARLHKRKAEPFGLRVRIAGSVAGVRRHHAGQINDHTMQALFTEITLTEAHRPFSRARK